MEGKVSTALRIIEVAFLLVFQVDFLEGIQRGVGVHLPTLGVYFQDVVLVREVGEDVFDKLVCR